MAVGRYRTHDRHVVVDYGPQTATLSEEDYHRTGYTPVFADLPFEEEWFAEHPDQNAQPERPRRETPH